MFSYKEYHSSGDNSKTQYKYGIVKRYHFPFITFTKYRLKLAWIEETIQF